ncbi:ribonuclease H-like domain-containing protein [Tanacetum coccineum]
METEFKNRDLLNVCGLKGSRGNTSIARTPQQNGVADEKELDLIEADHLGKFVGKSDEGFLVGYSLQSKAFRVYNLVTKRVEENLHINFLENKPNVAGKGPNWLFDLDYLTDSMNYHSVRSGDQANPMHVNKNLTKIQIQKTKLMLGILKKKMNLLKTALNSQYGIHIPQQTHLLQNQLKIGGPREEEQVFLDDLARLQRQEKEANEEAEALRKNIEQVN